MQHRDKIILQKIISEIDIGVEMVGKTGLEDFLNNEMLKRAIGMTVINIGELTKNITAETRAAYSVVSGACRGGKVPRRRTLTLSGNLQD